jgi:peroxiredoxin
VSRTTTGKRQRPPSATAVAQLPSEERSRKRRRLLVQIGVAVAAGVAILFFVAGSGDDSGSDGAGPLFVVGAPGPGEAAPPIRLESTSGELWDLQRDGAGQTTLLYFQEGLMCQPCWDQMRDIESAFADYQALGIDELVAITVDPVDLLAQKVADEDLDSTVLSDPDVSLGASYTANQYGMMGTTRYGHSFVVVGPDGEILWRADYGGPPDHTMYVSNDDLLADLRAGLDGGSGDST